MKRYIKLYKEYFIRAVKSRLEYKADAVIGISSFIIENICSLICLSVIINSINALGKWNVYCMGCLFGMTLLIKSVDHFFTDSLWLIGYWYIPAGLLDKHLTKPVNPLFQIISQRVQFEALGELILGTILFIVCSIKVNVSWDFSKIILMIICLSFGSAIITGIKMITSSIALWTKKSGQIMQVAYNISDCAKYPISIYNNAKVVKNILLYILPYGLIMSIPTEYILFGTCDIFENVYYVMGLIIGIAVILNVVGILLFNLGLNCYESVGN